MSHSVVPVARSVDTRFLMNILSGRIEYNHSLVAVPTQTLRVRKAGYFCNLFMTVLDPQKPNVEYDGCNA